MYAIKAAGLTKKYKDLTAVDHLDFTVEKGELYALLGVNGAGKTTTIKMLTCLIKPDDGDGWINGNSIRSAPGSVKKMIAVSPQESAVAMNLTVRENLELICGIHGFDKLKTEEKIYTLCEKFDLHSVSGKKAGELSGGWQRRLSIAMALISEPQVLFMDEPTLGLDVLARSDLWEIIRQMKGKMTIVLTTHFMEEAEALSDRIGIMKDGKLLIAARAEEIKRKAGKERLEDAFVAVVKGEVAL